MFVAEHEPFQRFIGRLYGALLGDGAGSEARVQAAMPSGAISVAVMHPLVADIGGDEFVAEIGGDELRANLVHYMRRMIDLPE